jgi:DNA-binding NarL/FixJ family response regulator
MNKITVLLADDHRMVREGFRQILAFENDLKVVGEASNGRRAVAQFIKIRPDIMLMDIAMPDINGLEATRQILKAFPRAKVLMVSAHSDDAYVANAIESGAMGFLLKQTSAHEVCRAIREVHQGKTFFSPSISRRFIRLHSQSANHVEQHNKTVELLTSRGTVVLQFVVEGNGNKKPLRNLASV